MKVLFLEESNKAMEVAGIVRFKEKHSPYYILFAQRGYRIADVEECEIIDASYRPEWQFVDADCDLEQSLESFPELYNNLDLWEDLFDGEADAEAMFEDKRRLYAGPNITSGRFMGFDYPMSIDADLEKLFRYAAPTAAAAQEKREELMLMLRKIKQSPFHISTSAEELYAFNLSIQLDEVGVALYLLRRTGVSSCLDEYVKYQGELLPPALMQALANESLDAVKLLLGFGANARSNLIEQEALSAPICELLNCSPQTLFSKVSS